MIDSVLTWALQRRLTAINHFRNHPHEVQHKLLQELLHTARDTEWGQRYGFADGFEGRELAQRVPVSSYEDLYPAIERVLRGEPDVLWPGRVTWFAKSSGTTNARSKYIPVTRESLEAGHYRAGRDMVALATTLYPAEKILGGKTLSLGARMAPILFAPTTPIPASATYRPSLCRTYLVGPSFCARPRWNWRCWMSGKRKLSA
ncbi:GH3 family domain-containing protein [Hymenobacter radiodurans]|uniref:GH3 family domain-containing protein n=1 Tax=Hymenobacter radiodurans TaxID=2496028 RepID=UPI00293926D4|nr:GH3 auxin-responsive promoter family protein [Hymenobacter radiodurans]